MKGIYILGSGALDLIYGPDERARIAELLEVYAAPQTNESIVRNPSLLADTEILVSGWDGPCMDENFLAIAPKLRVVFYGGGSIRDIVTDASWKRGVRITSAYAANAVPVSEYTLAMVLFSLKYGWQCALTVKREGKLPPRSPAPGCYGSTVGLVSLGMIGRLVRERLRPFDLRVSAYDPFVTTQTTKELGVEMVLLERLFREADVVSLHTPWLPETEGMITGVHFTSMKQGATFINTARGAVVREQEMIDVLRQRPDLMAILDVTHPEPPVDVSPLYTLQNVVLTPHIAGSMGLECRRMGRCMVEEIQRYIEGKPLQWEITQQRAAILA